MQATIARSTSAKQGNGAIPPAFHSSLQMAPRTALPNELLTPLAGVRHRQTLLPVQTKLRLVVSPSTHTHTHHRSTSTHTHRPTHVLLGSRCNGVRVRAGDGGASIAGICAEKPCFVKTFFRLSAARSHAESGKKRLATRPSSAFWTVYFKAR